MVPLSPADPFLFTQDSPPQPVGRGDGRAGQLHAARLASPDHPCRAVRARGHPDGPGPGRSAVRAVLQGMQQGKQIEIFTPSALARDSASRTVIAIWIYQDASMAVVHLDFQYKERYILWHAPDAHQFNYDYVEELRHRLSTMNLEVPDQLDRILSLKKGPG